MTAIRTILAPFLLWFQLLMVAGGPVVAQYCCGQRVELEAECATDSCCIEIEVCCDEEPDASGTCCEDDVELEIEFTQVGSFDAAVAAPSIPNVDPPCVVQLITDATIVVVDATDLLQDADVVGHCEPPDQTTTGVWRL